MGSDQNIAVRLKRMGEEYQNFLKYGPVKQNVCDVLTDMGITANYVGFHYIVDAVCMVVEDPQYLLLVTKKLYPEIASRYHTTWKAVERNIRTVIDIVWDNNPEYIMASMQRPVREKPTVSEFISILASIFWDGHTSEDEMAGKRGRTNV